MTLAPGTYIANVAALGIVEPAPQGEPRSEESTSVAGGCARIVELAAERPQVELTAAMARDQPACGISIDPAGPPTPRPEIQRRIRAPERTPRFRPRGAPTASAIRDGIKLELWVKDQTLQPDPRSSSMAAR